ncbi:MAG TPA: ABC transporter substrate-binding protein, partial [Firmicutes bacterium]|nr:ABC transporter substrate-binding protein [Bacillota bacterium]
EAGYPHFQFTMLTYSVARAYNPVNGQKLAEALQAELLKIGVKTTIKVYPWKEYFDVVNKGEEGDACFKGWIGDNGDPDNFLSLFDSSQIATNLNTARYSNPKVDELLREGTRTLNQKDRIKIYQQMQKILVADAPWVFINHATVLTAYQPKVKGFYPHPTGVSWLSQVSK